MRKRKRSIRSFRGSSCTVSNQGRKISRTRSTIVSSASIRRTIAGGSRAPAAGETTRRRGLRMAHRRNRANASDHLEACRPDQSAKVVRVWRLSPFRLRRALVTHEALCHRFPGVVEVTSGFRRKSGASSSPWLSVAWSRRQSRRPHDNASNPRRARLRTRSWPGHDPWSFEFSFVVSEDLLPRGAWQSCG